MHRLEPHEPLVVPLCISGHKASFNGSWFDPPGRAPAEFEREMLVEFKARYGCLLFANLP